VEGDRTHKEHAMSNVKQEFYRQTIFLKPTDKIWRQVQMNRCGQHCANLADQSAIFRLQDIGAISNM
jgi:hypothetical protein